MAAEISRVTSLEKFSDEAGVEDCRGEAIVPPDISSSHQIAIEVKVVAPCAKGGVMNAAIPLLFLRTASLY